LGLAEPVLPWHADRVRVGELAAALAVAAGAGTKVALDVVLLSQTEVGEVTGDAGGSSTLPHKRNPTRAVLARACGVRATGLAGTLLSSMAQEHERAAGAWHAEWPAVTELLRATGGCLHAVAGSLESLRVDAGRMQANLAIGHGLLMAERVLADLATDLGWEEAGAQVRTATERALDGPEPFDRALAGLEPVARVRTAAELAALCDPVGYLGAAGELVDRALASRRRAGGGSGR
ncbi:MAG: lyase family protein, partial [Acidimicrobiales bacterium]